MDAIPIPDAAPIVALPDDEDKLRSLISGTGAQSIIPKVLSNRGIPVTPQTQGRPIPVDRATGETEQLNDQGKPIAPGIAGLWAHAENIHNPFLRTLGKIGAVGARAIDVAGSVAAPGVMAQIPGTALNQKVEENRAEKRQTQDTANAATQARTAYEQEATREMPAKANLENAQAEKALRTPDATGKTPEESTIHDLMTGENGQPRLNPDTQKPYSYLEAYQAVNQAKADTKPAPKQNDFEQFYGDWLKDNNFPDTAHNRLMARKQYATAGQMPQQPQRVLAVTPDNKVVELTPGMTVPQGTKTVAGDLAGSKPTADEQKRADLVENLNENLDQLEDIVNRRPELFGKLSGRLTKAREWLGSDDPDVAALKGIEDRLGMVQQSSHGMRSAQHVEASANSVLNGFKNGPDAMKKAIADARKSGATFTKDVERGKPAATPAAPAPLKITRDANGRIIGVE